jgi:transcriptional regulator with XRE-family HTH domain
MTEAGEGLAPNQLVAYNLRRARQLRGWTQEQAAERLAPYLGVRWSKVTFSAAERSVAGRRVRQFDAEELVALSLAFGLPLAWWFLPPEEDLGAVRLPGSPPVAPAEAPEPPRYDPDGTADFADSDGKQPVTAAEAAAAVQATFGEPADAAILLDLLLLGVTDPQVADRVAKVVLSIPGSLRTNVQVMATELARGVEHRLLVGQADVAGELDEQLRQTDEQLGETRDMLGRLAGTLGTYREWAAKVAEDPAVPGQPPPEEKGGDP